MRDEEDGGRTRRRKTTTTTTTATHGKAKVDGEVGRWIRQPIPLSPFSLSSSSTCSSSPSLSSKICQAW
eukprot:5513361-Pyramimonas_sp.AAC.1